MWRHGQKVLGASEQCCDLSSGLLKYRFTDGLKPLFDFFFVLLSVFRSNYAMVLLCVGSCSLSSPETSFGRWSGVVFGAVHGPHDRKVLLILPSLGRHVLELFTESI